MINSRDIKDLDVRVGALALRFQEKCKRELGIDIVFTSTYRDDESQNALYAQGRTAPGRIVTKAKAGQSWHNYKLAFDWAPLDNGRINWARLDLWEKCGPVAESIGLEWAGRWTTFRELAHCQWTGGLSLKDLQAGKRP